MTTPVTLYAESDGTLSFYESPGSKPVEFQLADGYRVSEGLGGLLCIFGKPGQLGMSLARAIAAGVLRPVLDQ